MILIIQNGTHKPRLMQYISESTVLVKSYQQNVATMDISHFSKIIILGGTQSVIRISSYPYLANVVTMIKKCIEISKPVLGICLGCQLIAYALDCKIRSTGKLLVGYDVNVLGHEHVFRSHIDIIEPNDKIEIISKFEDIVYLFRYGSHIIGIQCHPDITPECIATYCIDEKSITYARKNVDLINSQNQEMMDYLLKSIE